MQVESALLFETPEAICARVFRQLRPRDPVPPIAVRFRPFANANSSVRLVAGRLELRVTDLLADAPAYVVESLAFILFSKLYRHRVPAEYQERYRRYLNAGDVRHRLVELRQRRGRKQLSGPQGQHRDLDALFDQLNTDLFANQLPKPRLGWSRRVSRTLLGHYDASHQAIVISRLLDSGSVPLLVLRYVMFHEMLHILHPVEYRGARRCVHTPDFRAAERRFPGLNEAKALLKAL